jgi:DNA mismatch repair protein PMS2
LELTAADELVAIENIEVLKENGLEIEVDDTANAGQSAKLLRVTVFPISKSTGFNMKGTTQLFPIFVVLHRQVQVTIVII